MTQNEFDDRQPMRPVLDPDAPARIRKVWPTLYHLDPTDFESCASWWMLLINVAALSGALTAVSVVHVPGEPLSALGAGLGVALFGVVLLLAISSLRVNRVAKMSLKRIDHVIQARDFSDSTKVNSEIDAAAADVTEAFGVDCTLLYVRDDLPVTIAGWQHDPAGLTGRELWEAASLARDLHDNEVRRARLVLAGDVAAAEDLTGTISDQSAALEQFTARWEAAREAAAQLEKDRRVALLLARRELSGDRPPADTLSQAMVASRLELDDN